MSIINNDQEVINEGRKNPLKDVAAPLRDQIPGKLLKKCNELKIGEAVRQTWYTGNANRSLWLARQQEFLADWDEFLTSSDQGAFEGSSSLHIPMPLIVSKTLHARFMQALLGIDPPFQIRPRTDASTSTASMVQEVMEYSLKDWANYYQGCYEAIDEWLWHWITTGCGLLKLRWDVEFTRFVDVVNVQEALAPRVEIDEQGNEQLVPQFKMVEKEQAVTKKKFEGPCFESILNEDLLIVGGRGNPQNADSVTHRFYMNASDLWTMVDREVFDEEAVKKVIQGGKDNVASGDGNSIKNQRSMNAGMSDVNPSTELDQYEILECYLKKDVDGSGINSDIVVWVHCLTGEILRATYLYRINKAGERPFFKIDFHKRAGQDYGCGIVEMMHPLSVEMDFHHNSRIDFGLLATMPFGFYRPTSNIDPETINLEPGALIPLDNPQADVYFPNLGNRTAFGFQEEQAIQTMIERLTGISDLSLGLLSAQGAARTATGARAILGESSANLDVFLRRLNLGWKKALEYLLHMLQQRLPEGFEFRLTGEDGANYFAYIKNREDIAGDYDLEVAPNTSSSNKSIQIENSQQLVNLTSNPLDIQLGIVTPRGRYEALKAYVSSLGVKDHGKYFQAPQIPRIFTPQEEVNRILRGVPTPVTPEADHEGYLAYFEYLKSNPELLGRYGQEEVLKLAQQAQAHAQMLAALEEQAAQARNAQQMQMNAAQSAVQAPVGMTPTAGTSGGMNEA